MMANYIKGLIPLFAAGGAGAMALAPSDAEAAAWNRPKYMVELADRILESATRPKGDPSLPGMNFGDLKGKRLKQYQEVSPEFKESPVAISGKNIDKFAQKRIGLDGLSPEDFVDGLNSVVYGTRSRVIPGRNGTARTYNVDTDGAHGWFGVLGPHPDVTGVVTGYHPRIEDLKKELSKTPGRTPVPFMPEPSANGGGLPGRLTDVGSSEKLVDESISDKGSDVNKKGVPAVALLPGSSDSVPADDSLARQFLLGTRGVLEGAGGVADYIRDPLNWINGKLGGDPEYFKNPGVVLSDSLGLPVPQNETERARVGLNQGVSGALADSATGAGIAKYGTGNVAQFGKFLADNPYINGAIGGLAGLFQGSGG